MAISADTLARYHANDEKRKALDRESRAIGKSLKLLDTELSAELERLGKTSIKRGDYRVSLIDGRAYVDWRGQFIEHAGDDLATEIAAAAEIPKRIQVTAE